MNKRIGTVIFDIYSSLITLLLKLFEEITIRNVTFGL